MICCLQFDRKNEVLWESRVEEISAESSGAGGELSETGRTGCLGTASLMGVSGVWDMSDGDGAKASSVASPKWEKTLT